MTDLDVEIIAGDRVIPVTVPDADVHRSGRVARHLAGKVLGLENPGAVQFVSARLGRVIDADETLVEAGLRDGDALTLEVEGRRGHRRPGHAGRARRGRHTRRCLEPSRCSATSTAATTARCADALRRRSSLGAHRGRHCRPDARGRRGGRSGGPPPGRRSARGGGDH